MRWWQECFQTWPTKCNSNISKIHSMTTNTMTVLLFYAICIYREWETEGCGSLHAPSPDSSLSTAALSAWCSHLHVHTHIVWVLICFVVMAVVFQLWSSLSQQPELPEMASEVCQCGRTEHQGFSGKLGLTQQAAGWQELEVLPFFQGAFRSHKSHNYLVRQWSPYKSCVNTIPSQHLNETDYIN